MLEDVMENRKVYVDPHNNLLKLEEHMYELVDVVKPNVFRNLFPFFRACDIIIDTLEF